MKTYISDIIPRIQRYSYRLDDLTKLTNQHWVSIGDIGQTKCVYIFRKNNQLLISKNGIVDKGTWEYLGNQSLLFDTDEGSFLLKHGFFDQNIIALKLDSTNNYAFFVNETKYDKELNKIEDVFAFLRKQYLTPKNKKANNKSSDYKFSKTPDRTNKNETVSSEQKEWIKNPNRCPACGFLGVQNKNACPDCGLHLTTES